jgi:hypothetical protein
MMKRLLKLRNIQIGLIVFAFLAVFISCDREKHTLMKYTWELRSMRMHSDSVLIEPNYIFPWLDDYNNIILYFPNKNEFIFKQKEEYNTIKGSIQIKDNKIDFKKFIYGEISDNQFMVDCVNLLINNINHYKIVGFGELVLMGDNGEELKFLAKTEEQ